MLLRTLALSALAAAATAIPRAAPVSESSSAFARALAAAEAALEKEQIDEARAQVVRALERDGHSIAAWDLAARVAEAAGDRDEDVYSRHRALELAIAQGLPKGAVEGRRNVLKALDPVAERLFGLRSHFISELEPLAQAYEKDGRPHSAIRVHREVLALAPEHEPSKQAIERLSALPDPSLAEHAEPADLLADVSQEWIREFDAEHDQWSQRAKHDGENYTTYTDAGYEVLIRTAEAMEQMNAFYRRFFAYGEDGGQIPKIDLLIFKDHPEYLAKGSSPKEWSGGQFTGGSVETHAGGGLASLTNTLFHEAAHQFVSLATNAAGWLNEGLASFFEGCRLQANGAVVMNLPATNRLFPLATRLEEGWMSSPSDGLDPDDPKVGPSRAPTFRMVVENDYEWGPAWYAPTWGVVYFLYNYQDPVDGRFVYRRAFQEFIDKSGGRVGKGAVSNFEEVVLANPLPPYAGVEREGDLLTELPSTIDELDPLWKDWILGLRDRQMGRADEALPYGHWARYAAAAGDTDAALDHFEKGLLEAPEDPGLLLGFAELLTEEGNGDRATKLYLRAARVLEAADSIDEARLEGVERALARVDPKRRTVERIQAAIEAEVRSLVAAYAEAELPMMVMHLARRMTGELGVPSLLGSYEAALRSSGRSLDLWQLAYDESSLEGWDAFGDTFFASGPTLDSSFGEYVPDQYDYRILALDRVTSGDYSLEARLRAERGELSFAGLTFGRKSARNFHALVLFPPKPEGQVLAGLSNDGWVDLASFYGDNSYSTWRHGPIPSGGEEVEDESGTDDETWHTLRVDVVGKVVDAWVDEQLVASQRFDSREVLAGGFGLITGPGSASFREVRFLLRPAGDPTSSLQRAIRTEAFEQGEETIRESYIGLEPPFPRVGRWIQGERSRWDERGPVPQLLVLWSIQQNDLVAVDGWLRDLAERHASVGLEIVSVCSPNDDEAIEAYLADHPFPGAVGVDRREGVGFGDTNEAFSTPRFNLPRLVLIDVDRRVVWEGDPGFSSRHPWSRGDESLLDPPLKDLIASRRLEELARWLRKWNETARPALAEGRVDLAAAELSTALSFDANEIQPAYEAQRAWSAVASAVAGLETTAERLEAEGRGPAVTTLLAWANLLEIEVPASSASILRKSKNWPSVKDWTRVGAKARGFRKKIERDVEQAFVLADKLEALAGAFPGELAVELRAAAAAGNTREALELLDATDERPRRWLAKERFGW